MANDKYKQSLSLCAFGQSRPPNVNDDASKGFSLGSIWSYEGRIYKLKNPANGAAEWFNSSQRFQQFPVYTVATEEVDLGVQTIQGVTQITSLFTAQANPADNGFYSWGGSSWAKPTFPFGVWLEEYDMMSGCLFTALDGTETGKGYVLNTGAVNFKFLPIGASNIPTELSSYFFSSINSDVSGYESMPDLQSFVAGSEANNGGVSVTTTPTLLGSFITDSGFPNVTKIPIGIFSAHVEVEKTAGSNNYSTFFRLYKRNLAGTETLLVTSDSSSEVAANTRQQISVTAYITDPITLLATDRIVIKWYSTMVSSTATITMFYDGTTNARLSIPATATGSGVGDVKQKTFTLDFDGSEDTFVKTHNYYNDYITYSIRKADGSYYKETEYDVSSTTTTFTVVFVTPPSTGTGKLTLQSVQNAEPAPSEGFPYTLPLTF